MIEEILMHSSAPQQPLRKGLVQIFTGEGKGKTSAALGTVVRALGHGLRVCIIVFMKGDYPYNEWTFFSQMANVRIERFGFRTFTDPANVKEEEKEQARQALAAAREVMLSGGFDLVVLDEVNVAAAWNLVEREEVVRLVRDKPPQVELILTGRYADPKLIDLADLVTECRKIKHPYDRGIKARAGIDF